MLTRNTVEEIRTARQVDYAECVLNAIAQLGLLYYTEYPNWEAEMLYEDALASAKVHCAELLAGWPGW